MSCNTISSPAFDNTIPVSPPSVKRIKKPSVNINGTFILRTPAHKVATQLKILIPVGTAMIIVAAVK